MVETQFLWNMLTWGLVWTLILLILSEFNDNWRN